MKRFNKRFLSSLLAVATMASLAACGSSSSGSGSSASSGANAPAAGSSDAASPADSTKSSEAAELSLWHIWPAGDSTTKIIDTFVEQYQKDNPHIKIKVDATQQDEYQQRKLKVAAANASQGDVFMTWGAGYSKPFVESGAVLPLDEYMAADGTKDRMLDGVLNYFTYDGKTYGLPLKKWVGVLFCNTELFTQYGVEYPETWEQMMTAVKTFRENDVTPMALGAKDAWHIGMIQNALAVRTAGVDASNQALTGEGTFDTPEMAQSAQLLVDLNTAGAFMNGTLGVSADEAQMEFYMGSVPMYYSGSWTAAACEDAENELAGKVKVLPLPTIEGGKGDASTYSGGAIDCYMINGKTKYPQQAFDFAVALTEYQSMECYKTGDSIPAWKIDVDESELNPVLTEIRKQSESATGYVLAWDTFLTGAAIDTHYNLLQGLIGGTVTPEQFAKEMQTANEAQLAAEAK